MKGKNWDRGGIDGWCVVCIAGFLLLPLWALTLDFSQRQRLRELLIRQQIQRNSLRQEKESAAAAASSSPAGWAPEAGGQSFELSRGMAPYQPAQVGELGHGAHGSEGGCC